MRLLCLLMPCCWMRIGNVLTGIRRQRKQHSHGQAGLYQCTRCKALSLGAPR